MSTMTYAATARCPCGAGLAYDETCITEPFKIPSYWDCSAILLGTADRSVQHTAHLPFSFYEIKSENQPSARGATTRPSHPQENTMTIAQIRKALVALGAASGVAAAALADGTLTASEAVGIVLAFLGALGVYRVRNEP